MPKDYIAELIQVAGVAVAAIQDYYEGEADARSPKCTEVLLMVLSERIRQDEKWGCQHHTRGDWLAILVEEVGEVAQAILENRVLVNPCGGE